jgi:nucleoside triphosphate pyrophosphatase
MTLTAANPILTIPNRQYILGSASPRRRELLKGLDIEFNSVSINADESISSEMALDEIPEILAKRKSRAYGQLEPNQVLITADTVVILEGEVINKPEDAEDSRKMLSSLSGKEHLVISGVYLRSNEKELSFSSKTRVRFEPLSSVEIDYYLAQYNPSDKAGSYGIQDWIGYIAISEIQGCYYNVMGLPLNKLYRELCAF